MAVQQLVDHFRAMMVFKGVSGKPDDVYVNTWHFRDNSGNPYTHIPEVLKKFYDDYQSGDPFLPITGLMHSTIVKPEAEIRMYDLGEPAPRQVHIAPVTLQNLSASGTVLPEEVAICMSFYGDRNLPRQRGRLYLGPLTTTSVAVSNGQTRVPSAVRDRIAGRAVGLLSVAADNVLHDVTWCVYSPSDNQAHPVTNGWIDDALDTVRRRGPEPSTRKEFAAP